MCAETEHKPCHEWEGGTGQGTGGLRGVTAGDTWLCAQGGWECPRYTQAVTHTGGGTQSRCHLSGVWEAEKP